MPAQPSAARHRPGFLLLTISFGLLGCTRGGEDEIVIASGWSAAERSTLEAGFRSRMETQPGPSRGPVRIAWVALMAGDDPTRVVRRRPPLDLVLGGPASSYRTLEQDDRLEPIDRAGHPAWCIVRRWRIVRATKPRARRGEGVGPSPEPPGLTFNDPRHDPIALEWAKGVLGSGRWSEGYARLVHQAATPHRIGRQEGSALAEVERGEAASTPAIAPPGSNPGPALKPAGGDVAPEWSEGVAIVRGARHRALAQEFVRYLDERAQTSLAPPLAGGAIEADALLADLLGATLVDAQDELIRAWAVLERAGRPGRAEAWMTEAPPWPPASIAKILDSAQDSPLVDTLTFELAPDADVRAWLVRSWLAPRRTIDGPFLAELAGAAGGRLVREPRFRAWLRGEWTAWARQRYRRSARKAGEALP